MYKPYECDIVFNVRHKLLCCIFDVVYNDTSGGLFSANVIGVSYGTIFHTYCMFDCNDMKLISRVHRKVRIK